MWCFALVAPAALCSGCKELPPVETAFRTPLEVTLRTLSPVHHVDRAKLASLENVFARDEWQLNQSWNPESAVRPAPGRKNTQVFRWIYGNESQRELSDEHDTPPAAESAGKVRRTIAGRRCRLRCTESTAIKHRDNGCVCSRCNRRRTLSRRRSKSNRADFRQRAERAGCLIAVVRLERVLAARHPRCCSRRCPPTMPAHPRPRHCCRPAILPVADRRNISASWQNGTISSAGTPPFFGAARSCRCARCCRSARTAGHPKPPGQSTGHCGAAPASLPLRSAAAEAWCLVLAHSQVDPVEGLASLGRYLERTDVPDGIRAELYRGIARWVSPASIPRLENALLETESTSIVSATIRRACVDACLTYACASTRAAHPAAANRLQPRAPRPNSTNRCGRPPSLTRALIPMPKCEFTLAAGWRSSSIRRRWKR